MLKQLTNTQVWVHDQDEALAFYTEKLGLELREDVTVPELGNFRWLTVGVPGQPDVAITLMAIPGPPVFDAETQDAIKTLVAKGVATGLFFATDDVQATYEELEGSRRRVPAGADRAAVRRRRRLPRPFGQPDARGAAEVAGAVADDALPAEADRRRPLSAPGSGGRPSPGQRGSARCVDRPGAVRRGRAPGDPRGRPARSRDVAARGGSGRRPGASA